MAQPASPVLLFPSSADEILGFPDGPTDFWRYLTTRNQQSACKQ
jgi:hypothetical protein